MIEITCNGYAVYCDNCKDVFDFTTKKQADIHSKGVCNVCGEKRTESAIARESKEVEI